MSFEREHQGVGEVRERERTGERQRVCVCFSPQRGDG